MQTSSAVGQPSAPGAPTTETVRQAWVSNFDAGFAGKLKALKVATDAAGNVYTLGQGNFGGSPKNVMLFYVLKSSV